MQDYVSLNKLAFSEKKFTESKQFSVRMFRLKYEVLAIDTNELPEATNEEPAKQIKSTMLKRNLSKTTKVHLINIF